MKHKLYTIAFLLFITFQTLHAQQAPDFMVKDSWGEEHQLYQYLDDGTTVVLKIFYVDCPPCNAIAPHLEPLYQSWGGGEADVEFIELSIRTGDSDEEVNGYKSSHGTTFPAVGGQGNSVPTTEPYRNGTFGPWTGTPTFVVIAPDKTLQYDVTGTGIEGTIEALDEAIAATGATGLQTSTDHPSVSDYITPGTKVVSDELTFIVHQDMQGLQVNVVDINGRTIKSEQFNVIKNTSVVMKVSSLAGGPWVCHIRDQKDRIMASYLFIKM